MSFCTHNRLHFPQIQIDSFLSARGYPLLIFIEKGKEWEWDEKSQEYNSILKAKLLQEPCLQYLNFKARNIEKDKLAAFESRMLNEAEQNYSTFKKEFLAVVWVCKHFRSYLL